MLISNAWAQAAAPVGAGASVLGTIIQLVGILLVFYLLLIRPQQKKLKQHDAELKSIKVGDEILTGGGIYARVTKVDGDDITAEVAKGIEVKMYRYTIREKLSKEQMQNVTIAKKEKSKGKK